MDIITAAEARKNFAEIINRTAYGKERIILTRRGKNIAAVVPLEDLNLIEQLEDELDVMQARVALEETNEHNTISLAKIKEAHNL